MATYDDILGNGGGTPFPKGSKEWHEQQQNGSSAPPPVKGTQEWAEQKAAMAPVVTAPKPDTTTTPPPPTKQEGSDGGALSYAELFKKLNPYTPITIISRFDIISLHSTEQAAQISPGILITFFH